MRGRTIINKSFGQNSINYKILEPYIIYSSANIIHNFKRVSLKLLFKELKKSDQVYSSLNQKYYKNLIEKNFHVDYYNNDFVSLNEGQREAISFLNYVKIEVDEIEFFNILLELETLNNLGTVKFDKMLLYKYINYQYDKYDIDKKLINSYFFVTYFIADKLVDELDIVINSIPDSLNDHYLNKYLLQKEIIDTLYLLGIEKIIDLKNTSTYLLIILYNHKTEDLFYILNSLKTCFKKEILKLLNGIKMIFEPRDYIILSGRNGWNGKKETLEDIGHKLHLTRERVRQKETKLSLVLYTEANKNKLLLNSFGYQLFNKFDCKVLPMDSLKKELEDGYNLYRTMIERLEYNNINYSQEYNVIYIGSNTDLQTYIEKKFKQIPLLFSENEFSSVISAYGKEFKSLVKCIIELNYKFKNGVYIQKKFKGSDLILLMIDKLFPTGYRISSDADFNLLKNSILEKYGDVDLITSKRQIAGLLDNHKYRLVDRGTYLNQIYLPKLSDYLVKNVIEFINKEGGFVNYDMIMYKFVEELNQLGINNKYMLKGVLDPEISNMFFTNRDYISKYKGVNSSTIINQYINSKNDEFSFHDLTDRFSGMKDYVLYNILYNRDDIIWLSNKRYVQKDNLHINDEVIHSIYEECENLFIQLKSNQISSKKIYAKLSFTNSELLKQIHVVKSHFDLFSVLQSFFKDKFYFNRPIISKTQENTNFYDMLKNYLSSKTEFNKEIVDGYSEKMNIRYLYSYLDFLEDMSEEYVQINVDTMIRKDAFDISEEELGEIDESLELILTRMKIIDTKTFKGYYIFPPINRRWNKYLLIGILRTYFSDIYDIENTFNTYDATEFLIRRRINEK